MVMILLLFCVLVISLTSGIAGEMSDVSYTGSKAFERMKDLIGVWEGTSRTGEEEKKVRVEYQSTAGGSAIIEKLFSNTPEEMVTVYNDLKGELMMTHYCLLKNQPQMKLIRSDKENLDFTLKEGSTIDVSKELHMHSLSISFLIKNHIVHRWTLYENGEKKGTTSLDLFRVR
jgi:hypothetical protein